MNVLAPAGLPWVPVLVHRSADATALGVAALGRFGAGDAALRRRGGGDG